MPVVRPSPLTLPLLALLAAGCATAPPPAATDSAVHAVVDEAYRSFSRAWAALDAEAAAALWTEDAMFIAPDADAGILRGRDQIEALYTSVFGAAREAGVSTSIAFRIVDRTVEGDLAADVGYAQSIRRVAGEEPVRRTSKFAIVLKREADGVWRFHVDSFSDAPSEAFDEANAVRLID